MLIVSTNVSNSLMRVDVMNLIFTFYANFDWLTWVRMNTVGVNGLRGGLPIALRREGTESVHTYRGGYARHGCSRDARGCAGACKWIKIHIESSWSHQG